MELNPQEIAELAEFFARRFPDREAPARFAAELRLDVGTMPTWQDVIELAHARGRLSALTRSAAEKRPEDPNLRELEATLGKAKTPGKARIVGIAVVAVLGIAVLARVASGPDSVETPAPPVHASVPAPPAPEAPVIGTPPVEAPRVDAPPAEAPKVEAPVVVPPAVVAPPADSAPRATGTVSGRCGGPAGARVGYWYAGSKAPGQAGELLTLRAGANVRTDYPRRDNRWRFSFPVVCSLVEGDKLRLTEAPIRVDGGDWWVPLYAGDLQQ